MGDETQPAAQGDEQEQAQGAEQTDTTEAQGATTQSQGDGGEKPKNPALEPRLSEENRKLRERIRAYEEAEAKRKEAEMSEAEKLAERQRKLEAEQAAFAKQRQAFAAQTAVAAEASKAGFRISPERVFALVRDQIEFDGDSPTNVRDVVAALAQAEPGLIGAANGSPTNPDRQRGSGLTAADIARMTDAEIEKAGLTADDMLRIAANG